MGKMKDLAIQADDWLERLDACDLDDRVSQDWLRSGWGSMPDLARTRVRQVLADRQVAKPSPTIAAYMAGITELHRLRDADPDDAAGAEDALLDDVLDPAWWALSATETLIVECLIETTA